MFQIIFSSQNQHFALCFLSCFDLVWSLLIGTGKLYKEAWGELLRSMGYVSWGGWAHNPVEGIWCARLSVQEGVSPSPPVAKLCGFNSLCRLIHESVKSRGSLLLNMSNSWCRWIIPFISDWYSARTPPECGVLNFLSSRFHSQVGIFVSVYKISLFLSLMLISEGIEFMRVCCSWGFFSIFIIFLLFIFLHLFLLGFFCLFLVNNQTACVADSQKYFLALVLNNVLH